jgi:hypothetical protein
MIFTETYIAILFMVIPGFITRGIYQSLNYNIREKTDFETTVSALIYSVFVICINFSVLFGVNLFQLDKISTLKGRFEDPVFVLEYAGLTLIVSIALAFLWDIICPEIIYLENWYRKIRKRNEVLSGESLWTSVFNDGKEHIVSVEIDGTDKGKGTLIGMSSSCDDKIEFQIRKQDEIKFLEDNGIELTLKATYFDLKNKIVIREYNLLEMK